MSGEAPYKVSVIRAGRVASSAETTPLRGVDGTPIAEVDTAPPLAASLTVSELRRRHPLGAAPAPDPETLRLAGRLFATATLGGMTPDDYCQAQARAGGIPIKVARHSLEDMAATCANVGERVAAERPAGTAGGVRAGEIRPMWLRRGDILSVIAPSNNPGTHTQWVHALAYGYQLVIRPGTRDPFTPSRLILAALEAGVEPSRLSLLPGGHATGDALVKASDLSLVFGGDAAVKRYGSDRRVILRGPGRSKILHTGEITERVVDSICDSVAYDAGLRCTNASAVFTDGDPAELGEAIARRLGAMVAAPPQSPDAELPVLPVEQARAMRAHLESRLAGAVDLAGARHPEGPLADLGDGSAALRPAVLVCDRADHPGGRVELPFPCVWVLPWSRGNPIEPLRDTLALSVLGDDPGLAALALREPSIRKVVYGGLPTHAAGPTSPHDGYLSQDLMEVRAYGIAAGAQTAERLPAHAGAVTA
ncbi:aldehyde dehydrogenase family protein [Sphaerisporangium sp. TRM90804]|uniref:aldehyde dehydrogenase family protein n=1 Tax=Sphaerisporangium sp. TRM90804 TaxID=3031113 RepID=UPI002449E28E|nr:aldehyde dehydrogenase family protein [Sphaerisporangium sp. TRM90804]MDH2428032.1 aldehyde dehydrogenase family protein [Sphaerisporangium sp. TRM90804]